MSEDKNRHNAFISHHHKDDSSVDKLQGLLKGNGFDVRNSSIRAFRPENKERWKNRQVSDETIKRLLRTKLKWASSLVVLVGKETHTRKWVDWEIKEAHRLGMRIIAVYEQGGTEADLPENFLKYGSQCVAWNTESIMKALNGSDEPFQLPDGSPRPTPPNAPHVSC